MTQLIGQTVAESSYLAIFARLGFACLLGGLIGIEREWKEREAGLRTHMLTALAAALFTVLTFEISMAVAVEDTIRPDPIRIIEAVTAGVAFLAAGTIIVHKGDIRGLTTGAGMWMAGAVGVACGAGYYWLATIATGLALCIFVVVRFVEKTLPKKD